MNQPTPLQSLSTAQASIEDAFHMLEKVTLQIAQNKERLMDTGRALEQLRHDLERRDTQPRPTHTNDANAWPDEKLLNLDDECAKVETLMAAGRAALVPLNTEDPDAYLMFPTTKRRARREPPRRVLLTDRQTIRTLRDRDRIRSLSEWGNSDRMGWRELGFPGDAYEVWMLRK